MTWAKYGTEFFDQLVDSNLRADLDDAAQLTHTQALHYLYSVESMEMTFKKSVLRRFATSTKSTEAAQELVRVGFWADLETHYKVIHHEDVFRQSLGYQLKERNRSKNSMRKKRQQDKEQEVPQEVTRNDTQNVMRTQTDSQTSSYREVPFQQNFNEETGEVFDPPIKQPSQSDPWANVPMKTDSAPNIMDQFMNADLGRQAS